MANISGFPYTNRCIFVCIVWHFNIMVYITKDTDKDIPFNALKS